MYKSIKNLAMFAATAAACCFVSCTKPEDDKQDSVTLEPGVSLVSENDAVITIVAEKSTREVALKLENITKDELEVKVTGDGNKCSAAFSETADAVIVNVGQNILEDYEETVSVVSKEDETKVYVSFKVVSVAGYIRVTSVPAYEKGEYTNNLNIPGEKTTVTFTVETNFEKWYFGSMDVMGGDNSWIEASQTSGRSGETCTVTFAANDSDSRMAYVYFDNAPIEFMGGMFTLVVTQEEGARPSEGGATRFKLYDYDDEWEPVLIDGNSFNIEFKSTDAFKASSVEFAYYEKDGDIDFKYCVAGTTDEDSSFSNWVKYTDNGEWGFSIMPTSQNDGAERKIDLVVFSAGTKYELFRFVIVQKAKN